MHRKGKNCHLNDNTSFHISIKWTQLRYYRVLKGHETPSLMMEKALLEIKVNAQYRD